MKNTSQSLEKSTKDDILSKYMYKMKLSGYRSECLLSAKNAFSLLVQKHEADGKPIFRNREELSQFKAMKNKTPSNWWKAPTNSRNQYTAVMFVPPTPGGELAKRLKQRETELNSGRGMNIRFIEKPGIKMKNLIVKKDSFPPVKCSEKKCPFCNQIPQINTIKNQRCSAHSVGYRFKCEECDYTYEGETYRKIAVRSAEHVSQLEKESKQSPLWKHTLEHHPERGHSLKFKLSITGSFFDSLSRQADEGERIHSRKGKLMNSKSEFHDLKLNRITIKEVNY